MNCLFITNPNNKVSMELVEYLEMRGIPILSTLDPLVGIQKAQEQHFDVIILEAQPQIINVERAIRLLKGCDPLARIIVHTESNSRSLESKVRKEQIFYYHVDSFGTSDLKLAVSSALKLDNV